VPAVPVARERHRAARRVVSGERFTPVELEWDKANVLAGLAIGDATRNISASIESM